MLCIIFTFLYRWLIRTLRQSKVNSRIYRKWRNMRWMKMIMTRKKVSVYFLFLFWYTYVTHFKNKTTFLVQWNLSKADTIGTKKNGPSYRGVRFIEIFFVRVWPEISLFRSKNSVCFIEVSVLERFHCIHKLLHVSRITLRFII